MPCFVSNERTTISTITNAAVSKKAKCVLKLIFSAVYIILTYDKE